MKVLPDIDDDKADFVMDWLHGLSFVKAEPLVVQGEFLKNKFTRDKGSRHFIYL